MGLRVLALHMAKQTAVETTDRLILLFILLMMIANGAWVLLAAAA